LERGVTAVTDMLMCFSAGTEKSTWR